MQPYGNLQRALTAYLGAFAISFFAHIVLFAIAVSSPSESSMLARITEAILTPAAEMVSDTHSFMTFFNMLIASLILYSVLLWPFTALAAVLWGKPKASL